MASLHGWLNSELIRSVEDGDYKRVAELIQQGADVHVNDDYCLCYAVSMGYSKTAEILINAGADVSIHGNYPIRDAIWNEHDGTLGVMFKTAVIGEDTLRDALKMAVAYNKVKSAKVMLEYCKLRDECFEFLVEEAISARNVEMTLLLVKRMNDVQASAKKAIEIAQSQGAHMDFLAPLLQLIA